MSEINWKELIEKARENSQSAQAELITLTEKKLFKFCFMLTGKKEEAEDLCQEALIKALQNLSKLSEPQAFQGWLFQLTRNLFLDSKKSGAAKEKPTESPLEGETVDPEMETALQVQFVLSHFEPEDRFLILLIELEGYSYAEAAKSIQSTEDAVRSKIHRLRQEFLNILKKSETNSPAHSSLGQKVQK